MRRRVNVACFHGLGSAPSMFSASPNGLGGIEQLLNSKEIYPRIPLLSGHGQTVDDLAAATGESWLLDTKGMILELINKENEESFLIGFELGGLLELLALAELLLSREITEEQANRITVIAVNTPYMMLQLSWSRARKLTSYPRMELERTRFANEPRDYEPNHEYLKQVLVSKQMPLSAILEMMKLVWRLDEGLRSQVPWEWLKGVHLIQATPGGVIDPNSVEVLRRRIGEASVYYIENATHAFPEVEPWEKVRELVNAIIH